MKNKRDLVEGDRCMVDVRKLLFTAPEYVEGTFLRWDTSKGLFLGLRALVDLGENAWQAHKAGFCDRTDEPTQFLVDIHGLK
jgi:hypothetical protein